MYTQIFTICLFLVAGYFGYTLLVANVNLLFIALLASGSILLTAYFMAQSYRSDTRITVIDGFLLSSVTILIVILTIVVSNGMLFNI